jgi:hypothetical protein
VVALMMQIFCPPSTTTAAMIQHLRVPRRTADGAIAAAALSEQLRGEDGAVLEALCGCLAGDPQQRGSNVMEIRESLVSALRMKGN